ncbi:3-isopropylmalate dehydratase [Ottowia sp.]|jgi:3-isopropylmalate/(R)-2-methylmalate dehydratase small subunit|uniref:LeuD/DmdB family oxidoreductase small subunit n=1 Tax=Ottowia sp. TaxID=1898956 RepID=UPI0025D47516|nr:3-isopropylmalate dehydratase [Ottowia sp.]MBK6745643.1 3-isopropylmalate dehydratase [Ottowia sp.]
MSAPLHRVWRLGADVDTDALAPGHAMKHGMDVIARHCLESLRPDFAGGVRPGDLLVAGPNFGIGSSREQAAAVLVALGVQAVVAPSYSGLFFRNAFNVGLLLLTCAQAERLEEGERVGLDHADPLAAGLLRAGGERLTCDPVPPFLVERVRCGGLLNELKQRLARGTP